MNSLDTNKDSTSKTKPVKRGRGSATGEQHGLAKLTEAQVREIRKLKGTKSCRALAEDFGVTHGTIHSIHHRRTWKHVA